MDVFAVAAPAMSALGLLRGVGLGRRLEASRSASMTSKFCVDGFVQQTRLLRRDLLPEFAEFREHAKWATQSLRCGPHSERNIRESHGHF